MEENETTIVPMHPSNPDGLWGISWGQIVAILAGWLALLALGSLFVSNPFWDETGSLAKINYAHTMYLHGLLVGLAGITSLVAAQIFGLRSRRIRLWIIGATVFATLLGGFVGIFDRSPHDQVWVYLHVLSFFALDSIFIALFWGFFVDWRERSGFYRSLSFWVAWMAVVSLELAALMGHAAGWILDFKDWPPFVGGWATLMGEKISDLEANLVTSHSHEMVVALLALLVAVIAARFGYEGLKGGVQVLSRIGMWLVAAGTALMTLIYVVGGITNLEPPQLFAFGPGGVNGIAGDDLVTGVGVMIGGFLVLLALYLGRRGITAENRWLAAVLGAMGWLWLLLVSTMIIAGYAIELNETFFGAGAKAPGAISDAVFTFAHQDFAFFLLPALVLVLLVSSMWLNDRVAKWLSLGLSAAAAVTFVGVMIYMFIDPAVTYGVGYIITGLGVAAIFFLIWYWILHTWRLSQRT